MEEECDSREQSEEDSSPTDTSEDSVEVKVNRICLPDKYTRALLKSIDLRKAHSSSPKRFEPLDFSNRQLNSVNCYNVTESSSTDVAEEQLSIRQNSCPKDERGDRKYSRRKASDPRRLLSRQEKRAKRCFAVGSNDDPPSKLLRHDEKPKLDTNTPGTNIDTRSYVSAEPSTFQPLFLSALHPMMKYPYSQVVNNVIAPHLNILTHGLHSANVSPYSVLSALSPIHTPHIDISSVSNNANPVIDRDRRNSNVDDSSPISHRDLSTERDIKITELSYCIQSENMLLPVKTDTNYKEQQDGPIDYSINKTTVSKQKPADSSHLHSPTREVIISDLNTHAGKHKQRNYKNMTRERRIEANARERTRVHTISAAFEKLRQSVPSYSSNQKLSKLSVLRIACTYILSLSRLAGLDYSLDEVSPTFAECVDLTTKTIQTEGKTKKRKDD